MVRGDGCRGESELRGQAVRRCRGGALDAPERGPADRGTAHRGERGDSTYSLLVYRVEDGVLIHTLHAKRSAKETVKRTEKGPLILRDNGVEVFGTRFEFNGTKLIKPVAEDMK